MGTAQQFFSNLRLWPGPILAVDLITTSRRKRYFALRVLYATALFFALFVAHSASLRNDWVEENGLGRLPTVPDPALPEVKLCVVE